MLIMPKYEGRGVKKGLAGRENHVQLQNPREVAVDGEGNILVADSRNHRIQRFTSEGQFLGTEGSGHLQFSCPTGIE